MKNTDRTFVIGDIHGSGKALTQCLSRSGFNYEKDLLISLGDLTDGWPDSYHVFEQLLKIKHVVLIKGNHDKWARHWMLTGEYDPNWYHQGGKNTINSYPDTIPDSHKNFYNTAKPYFLLDNAIFVHGGFDPDKDIHEQTEEIFLWDRSLVQLAKKLDSINPETQLSPYKRIFLGHTPTLNFESDKPINYCNVTLMDTGAGWPGGRLSIMDIETGNVVQSDKSDDLYPGVSSR